MKKGMCILLSLLLLMGLTIPAAAAETGESVTTEPTACSHSWGTAAGPDATCTAAGTKTSVCSLCGATKTDTIPALGHSFGSWTSEGEAEHKRVCSACGAEEKGIHSQSSENITVQATCTAEGKKDVFCLCGYKIHENVTIPKVAHTYGAWIGDNTKHSRTCSVCEAVDAGEHQWGTPKVTKEATCKTEGEQVYTCSVCAKTKLEVVAKKKEHTYDNVCDPVCNVCEAERDAGHKYSKVWSKNFAGHWHECTACGDKTDEEKHFPGPAATEEKAQLCLTCGYEMTPKKNHKHEYDNVWSSDKDSHWHGCTGCEEQKDYALHSYDSACDDACNVCGYKNTAAHSFEENWQSDEKSHWSVCSLCGEEKQRENHVPGPEATDTEAQLCTVCGYELSPMLEHTHEFGPVWLNDGQTHWQKCQCGEESLHREHTWDEGREESGNKIRFTCTECGMQRMEAQKTTGVFWWILLVVLLLLLAAAVVALIIVLRMPKPQGKYSR